MELLTRLAEESVTLWLNVSPYLLLGMLIAGLLHTFLNKELISRHLGKGGVGSIVKGTLFGIPLPVCSCGIIPIANSLEKDGAHKSAMLSFLVSTPTTGVDSILATYSLLGPLFALFRPLGALISGVAVGAVDFFIEGRGQKKRVIPPHTHRSFSFGFRWIAFIRYVLYEIPQDIGASLLVGIILGGAISTFIPRQLIVQYIAPPFDIILALIIGLPLYVCATGSIPIAASLIAKGFTPGAALVFLIAGPATNTVTLSFVRTKMGRKSFYLYLSSIALVSLALGFIMNSLWGMLGSDRQLMEGVGGMISYPVRVVCGIILFCLIGWGMLRKKTYARINTPDTTLDVPDIHCSHCKMTLQEALASAEGIDSVSVDVKEKKVMVRGAATRDVIVKKIRQAGYHPKGL